MRTYVTDFGAASDSPAVQTAALQSAIDDCHNRGGGTVVFPAGIYVTGTLELRSNITIELEAGAILQGSSDMADYPSLGIRSGNRDTALLVARHAKNVCVVGHGTLDGNGDSFFLPDTPIPEPGFDLELTRQGPAYDEKPGGVEDGPIQYKTGPHGEELRPGNLLLMVDCEEVHVTDITVVGSPNWCLHFAGCRFVTIRGLVVRNSLLIPNADCIDIGNSSYVNISDCYLEAGDDGIALTPCADGYHRAPCEYVNVSNCTIVSRSAAIRVGYGIEPIRNCNFSNLHIFASNRAIGVFVRNGQIIENITFSNVTIETRLHTGWWGAAEPIHISAVPGYTDDTSLGMIRNVRFFNVTAESENGILIYGADHKDGKPHIADVLLENVSVHVKRSPLEERYGGNIDLRPSHDSALGLFKSELAGLYAKNVDGLVVRHSSIEVDDDLPEYFDRGIKLENVGRSHIHG